MGSGKLVLLNGSVSSKNCTLHINVAIVYPCKAILDDQNSGCDTSAVTDAQAPGPDRRATGRSSAVAKNPLHPVILGPSPFASRCAQGSGPRTQLSRSKDPGALLEGDTVSQGDEETSGAAVSKGIAGG